MYKELSDKFRPIIKILGFTESEVKVYFALLTKSDCSVTEIARITGIPRNHVYGILTTLEEKGACLLRKGRKKLYEPIEPEILVKRAKYVLKEDSDALAECADFVKSELGDLYDNRAGSDGDVDYITVYRDPIALVETILKNVSESNYEILSFSRDLDLVRQVRETSVSSGMFLELGDRVNEVYLETLKGKKTEYRQILTIDQLGCVSRGSNYEELVKLKNVGYSVLESVPNQALVFDRERIILFLPNRRHGGFSLTAFFLQDKGLGEVLARSFYTYFDEGVPIQDIDIEVSITNGHIVKKS
ncbi:MAG: helix-turn-helix domain-containing protein [bacterium]|nr:helix-turn-helix domain-containing protein [bacterium]